MSYAFYPTSSDCSGTPLYFGYETAVKAVEYGTFCVTDKQDGIDMYAKWVIQCETSDTTALLPPAVYEFLQSCTDVDCQNCSEVPISAIQVPWSNFDNGPPQCMVTRAFNATTTNPAEEFANMTVVLDPPTSESFGPPGASSSDELNEYWQYYIDNSCIGNNLPTTNVFPGTTSSGYVTASGSILIQFVVFLSFQAYYMLMM